MARYVTSRLEASYTTTTQRACATCVHSALVARLHTVFEGGNWQNVPKPVLECRLKPPVAGGPHNEAIFPRMQDDDWCSKYYRDNIKIKAFSTQSETLPPLLQGTSTPIPERIEVNERASVRYREDPDT